MIFDKKTPVSEVFGEGSATMENTLKNPNQFREAVLFESLAAMPARKLREFVRSPEAKAMVEGGILTADTLDRLSNHHETSVFDTAVCKLAKDNDDPLWTELISHRIQERRIMNELIAKYGDQARPVADNAHDKFVAPNLPEYFAKEV